MIGTRKLSIIEAIVFCRAGFSQKARAGGVSLHDFATRDVGLASAVHAVRAEDASTLFNNPTDMSFLEGPALGRLAVLVRERVVELQPNTSQNSEDLAYKP